MTDSARSARLNRVLNDILRGRQPLRNHKQFIEAICNQEDAAGCMDKLIACKDGLNFVQASLRSDLSVSFLNGTANDLLCFLQKPEIKTISNGQYLDKILLAIVDPPIFWNAFVEAFKGKQLSEGAQRSFAWTLLQLLVIPSDTASPYIAIAQEVLPIFAASFILDIRNAGEKIKHTISVASSPVAIARDDIRPGGRHDNDFADFRQIAILPTAAELISTEAPFLRPSSALNDPSTEEHREAIYLDNQFRLMREDLIHEMREELQIAMGKQKGRKHRGFVVDGLKLIDVNFGEPAKRKKWGLIFECKEDLPQLKKIQNVAKRRDFWKENFKILKHQSLACLIVDGEALAFPSVRREEDLLAKKLPQIVLEMEGDAAVTSLLLRLKSAKHVKLIQIDAAAFAFEPILNALKRIKVLPLADELLYWQEGKSISSPSQSSEFTNAVRAFEYNPKQDIKHLLKLNKNIILDKTQAQSLLSGLKQSLSIIQGPPGTGKSFIGALLAKFIYDFSEQKILVVCYTNHALDQFLEDLLDIGIPSEAMVRIGGKSTTRTEPMKLQNQPRTFKFGRGDYTLIDGLKQDVEVRAKSLDTAFEKYLQATVRTSDLLLYLEFEEPDFFEAFRVPISEDGMTKVGKKGEAIRDDYLLSRWCNGQNAGIFIFAPHVKAAQEVWSMSSSARKDLVSRWEENMLKESIEELCDAAGKYNKLVDELARKFSERDAVVLCSKRIIGCTTTAAAKYSEDIRAAAPDVILVEEAGEILESHVLTSLGKAAKQLVLIGDHKQLRPKVNNYKLTVEKGDGYDLNVSLFERLVLKGYPHQTLVAQHRMRPEISALIRHLTYPDLLDADKTKNRPNIRGLRDNVIFINHGYPEDDMPQVADSRDLGSKSSKQNTYEARMVLKIVKYLAQQSYGTDKMVVLTPYLGQLSKLRNELQHSSEVDPVLNDLDSYDLIRAGLLSAGGAKSNQRKLRLSTIDNYQGEESEIVVVSLTRSNSNHDIGFMFAPERLNVLLSRARNAIIMIGNSDTFTKARKGKELWQQLFELLKGNGHIYDGLPVKCEQHPDRTALLKTEDQFETECPDGGCSEPCGAKLSCGLHTCPSKCHQLYDHSKMRCSEIVRSQCSKGHDRSRRCSEVDTGLCKKCEREAKAAELKRQKDFERQKKRDEEEAEHLRRVKELEEEFAAQQLLLRDAQIKEERENQLNQKKRDIQEAKEFLRKRSETQPTQHPSSPSQAHSAPDDVPASTPQPSTPTITSQTPQSPPTTRPTSDTSTKKSPTQKPSPVPPRTTAKEPTSQKTPPLPPRPTAKEPTSEKPPPLPPRPTARGIPTSNPTATNPSPSTQEWQRIKSLEGVTNDAIDAIMDMVGLEEVKKQVLGIYNKIVVAKRQFISVKDERFNIVLLGNPGTGKTTVARQYSKFLASLDVLPGLAFQETTGSRLANDGVPETKKLLEGVLNAGGGSIFVDEAYQLTSDHNFQGKQVLDFLLAEMENNVGRLVFILAGYNKEMEKFFEHNPGLKSRVPHTLQFDDYKDEELRYMLEKRIHKKFSGRMKIEDGIQGLYGRIAIRRLGRGRGQAGFGNARALENLLSKIHTRQTERIAKERKAGYRPDDLLFVKEDLIGPDPSQAFLQSDSWTELQKMIGLGSVKTSILSMIDMISLNYQRELEEEEPMQVSLNRVFLGSPGTGKTTVAGLYGRILADLGLLSNGEVVIKSPSDFVGSAIGESQKLTKAILANTVGKVLIIDEAYMLYGGGKGGQKQSDPYKTDVVDTIVAEVQSKPGEDRCVLLLGYKDQMLEMFQNVNEGLSRRFAIEDAFNFEDFSTDELRQILEYKLKKQSLHATEEAKTVALDVLNRAKVRPNFGNAGEVENLLSKAKTNYMGRIRKSAGATTASVVLEPSDFDPDFERAAHASDNLDELFKDVVGCEDVVTKLRKFQKMAQVAKQRNKDARELVPTCFVFKGPPGTGKTTTARKMGQVYFDMGFLSRPEVNECSASDLVGQYVGHTGPKVLQMLEKALGQVLFIDEAYRLREGHFAQEAIDEIVSLLTQDRFKGKIVVILAGYDEDINQLLAVNRGLASRFPEEIFFRNLGPEECLTVLGQQLKKDEVYLEGLDDPSADIHRQLCQLFFALSQLPSWGNARDVITIAKDMAGVVIDKTSDVTGAFLTLDPGDAIACVKDALARSLSRNSNRPKHPTKPSPPFPVQMPDPMAATPPSTKTATATNTRNDNRPPAPPVPANDVDEGRDPGVSDAVWAQLQFDKAAEIAAQKKREEEIRRAEEEVREAHRKEEEERKRAIELALAEARERDFIKQQELKRQREQQRIMEEKARRERERQEAELKAQREAEARARQQEAKAQQALRKMGVCVAGFRWIKQGGGYRCAGGSHFVSDAQLGI